MIGFLNLSSSVASFANGIGDNAKAKSEVVAPVMPLSGNATEEGNQVAWAVPSADDLDFFVIQRSDDGETFRPIAMVEKKDDLAGYAFTDKRGKGKHFFYRVVKVAKNGDGEVLGAIFL